MQTMRGARLESLWSLALCGLLVASCVEATGVSDTKTDAGPSSGDPARPSEGDADDDSPTAGEPALSDGDDASAGDPPRDNEAPPLDQGPSNSPDEPEANVPVEPDAPANVGGATAEMPSTQGASGTAASNAGAAAGGGAASNGCGTTPEPSLLEYQTLDVDGSERRYLVSIPANYDSARPYPLMFAFHGAGDTGAGFKGWSGVESVVEAIHIYPDGVNGIWGEEVYTDDFRFERGVYEWTTERFCVDTNRVFAYGFSWGGWATTQFACNSPDLLRGVIEIAGGGPQRSCDVPIPLMLIHGSADEAEPISSSENTRGIFLELNGCSQETSPSEPNPCLLYQDCDEPVVWCGHEGAHGIPDFGPQAIASFVAALD